MAYLFQRYVSPSVLVTQALQDIPGIGMYQASQICDEMGFSTQMRVCEISQHDWEHMQQLVSTYYHTGQDTYRRRVQAIRRLIAMGTYRGFRHVAHLPVRGQRTHTNARSRRRSPRITATSRT